MAVATFEVQLAIRVVIAVLDTVSLPIIIVSYGFLLSKYNNLVFTQVNNSLVQCLVRIVITVIVVIIDCHHQEKIRKNHLSHIFARQLMPRGMSYDG